LLSIGFQLTTVGAHQRQAFRRYAALCASTQVNINDGDLRPGIAGDVLVGQAPFVVAPRLRGAAKAGE